MQIPLLNSLLSMLGLAGQSNHQTIDVGYAKYTGLVDVGSQVTNFYGIKYAKAPVGELRWQAPVPVEEPFISDGPVIDATQPSIACVMGEAFFAPEQNRAWTESRPQGEDCLSLNIQTPSNIENSSGLPVLVNIHGGGYLGGDKDVAGTFLIHETNNSMVYVSVNYRLGMYGFLGGSQVKSQGVLNAGLLDQRLALEWVKNHIHAFGGDPGKVTVIGDSAGGGSVTYQLTAFDGTKYAPFRAAIAQYPWWTPVWSEKTQEIGFQHVLKTANCSDIQCLRQLDEDTLRQVSAQVQRTNSDTPQSGYGLFTFSPVIDGDFVRQRPSESFKAGKFQKVPIIVTRSLNEGAGFTNMLLMDGNQTAALHASLLDVKQKFPTASKKFLDEFLDLYKPTDFANIFQHRSTWFGDAFVNCPTYIMANNIHPHVPIYKMIFSTGTTYHGASQPYIFSPYTYTSVLDQKTSKTLARYFNSFVATGDPNAFNGADSLLWKNYHNEDYEYNVLHIKVHEHVIEKDPDFSDRCEFMFQKSDVISN